MSRIETIGDATLYLGDCREILPTLGKVDAVVTDPPYGLGKKNCIKHTSRSRRWAKPTDYGDFDWDERPADPKTIAQILAQSDWQIIFGGNYFHLPPTSCWLVWDKLNGDNYFADCELAWTNLHQSVRRIYWRWLGMIRRGDDVRVHPTQKPEGVMAWCLDQLPAAILAGTILDPFMGSGTTGVASSKAGFKFIGIEIEPKYFDIACRRIEAAYAQPDIFIPRPTPAKQEALL